MRYTLKDYQEDAVDDVLRNLADARDDWHRKGRKVAFSLTATTGAGKTVMAAAVIESLFHGNPDFDFEPDAGAVVLWFTDDPALNEQTRFRLLEAGDRIAHSRLVVIENTFDQEKLEPGRVYFLNRQKLSKTARLVRNAPESLQQALEGITPPDGRAFSIWDTLANTIGDDRLTLYMILDEAHRGMKAPTSEERAEKATVVQRLINGAHGVPAVPIVWGISATVERFNDAMSVSADRTTYPPVEVDPARVQESGLLKDDIRLEFPTESGQFDTVLLARGAKKARKAAELWERYATREGSEPVVPLLVVQVPNKPSQELLRSAFATVTDAWPEVTSVSMAHVFGDRATIEVGGFAVPYVSPEQIQDRTHIRVVFAKDAISTGWDCPRAEVLVSFRPAKDRTHITQLLGRMVRTPLARRIPGDDTLNSVLCVLPHFSRSTAASVVGALMGDREQDADGTGGGAGRRVLVAPEDMTVNQGVPSAVWEVFDGLPSQTLPRKVAKPVRRLMALAQALSRDELRADARKEATKQLCSVLDGSVARFRDKLDAGVRDVSVVEGETIASGILTREVSSVGAFEEAADDRAISAEFKAAGRAFTPDLARAYAEHVAEEEEDDDGLLDAHMLVAAMGRVEEIAQELDEQADKLAHRWFDEYRVAIKGLSDERRSAYDQIRGMSTQPQQIGLMRPRVRTEETERLEGGRLETRPGHLMSDADGEFPVAALNDWELGVLDAEMARPGFRAWYRNPSRPSADALAVAYQDQRGRWRRMCPDLLVFHGEEEDIRVSLVDPHGVHLSDALAKLKGLAVFAAEHGDAFHRIEAIAKVDGSLRVLDFTEEHIRRAVEGATDPVALYREVGAKY